jgi:HEPN domain-containing protein
MALSEAEGLLRIASADLETALASTDPTVFREAAWGFWLQQAIEKSFKAWLVHLGDTPPQKHDLLRLLRMLELHGVDAAPLLELTRLTIFAVQFRYDAELMPLGLAREPLNSQVQDLLLMVEAIVSQPPPTVRTDPTTNPSKSC